MSSILDSSFFFAFALQFRRASGIEKSPPCLNDNELVL